MVQELAAGPSRSGNETIKGVPTVYYFNYGSTGCGQVIPLFFEDNEIAFKDMRIEFTEYAGFKRDHIIPQMNPTGSVPIVEFNGKYYTQGVPILVCVPEFQKFN